MDNKICILQEILNLHILRKITNNIQSFLINILIFHLIQIVH